LAVAATEQTRAQAVFVASASVAAILALPGLTDEMPLALVAALGSDFSAHPTGAEALDADVRAIGVALALQIADPLLFTDAAGFSVQVSAFAAGVAAAGARSRDALESVVAAVAATFQEVRLTADLRVLFSLAVGRDATGG
jgi:hypothetical protein